MRERLGNRRPSDEAIRKSVALREVIAKRPRSDDIAQRRPRDIDRRGRQNKLAAMSRRTGHRQRREGSPMDHRRRMPIRGEATAVLHGGGYVIGSLDSHRHLAAEIGRAGETHACDRLSARAGAPFPRRSTTRSPPIASLLANGVPSGALPSRPSAGRSGAAPAGHG
jgi:acetyl esterase/lipase